MAGRGEIGVRGYVTREQCGEVLTVVRRISALPWVLHTLCHETLYTDADSFLKFFPELVSLYNWVPSYPQPILPITNHFTLCEYHHARQSPPTTPPHSIKLVIRRKHQPWSIIPDGSRNPTPTVERLLCHGGEINDIL